MARSPAPAVSGDDRLLVPYWLRAVRIGLWATMIVLVTLAVLPFVPHAFPIDGVA
jgi:hypothetical protein